MYDTLVGRRLVRTEMERGNLSAASGTLLLSTRWFTRDKITITGMRGFLATAAGGTSATKFTLKIWAGAGAGKGNPTANVAPGAGRTGLAFTMPAAIMTAAANTWLGAAVHTVGAGTAGGGMILMWSYNHGWNQNLPG